MATRDFDTKLDDALTQLVRGGALDTAVSQLPDASDLISLTSHLQILAPVPEPRLEGGRMKFLNEAASMAGKHAASRRALSFAIATVIVLIAASVLVVAAISDVASKSFVDPTLQATLFPTQSPTVSATPISSFTPNHMGLGENNDPHNGVQKVVPFPNPTPVPRLQHFQQSYVMTWCLLDG